MLTEFEQMAADLKAKAQGREVVYIPNPGNFGDGLIRYGAKQFLSDFDIPHIELNVGYARVKYQLAPYLLKRDRYFFIYGGGGAWCEAYSFGRDYCRFISRFTDRLAVLPSTYALGDLPRRGLMYRRDKAESATRNPASRFCHDMALYVACRKAGQRSAYPRATQKVGVFMRTDKEGRFPVSELPDTNVDISRSGDHMSNGDDFLNAIAQYELIYTDRLHVCIAACIVGRRVKLVTGNYFKIRRIFEASILPGFGDLVELLGDDFKPSDIVR